MQGRRDKEGSVPLVPAPDIEQLVIASLRSEAAPSEAHEYTSEADRQSILQQVRRVEVRSGSVFIEIGASPQEVKDGGEVGLIRILTVPSSPPVNRFPCLTAAIGMTPIRASGAFRADRPLDA
jgi:hypothetical protein